jgi:membrane protein DedA with SNARE-associated domain
MVGESMSPSALQYLQHYGVVILPALAVAEQIGLPLPAMPALLAVGALAAHGRSSIPLVLGAISAAALAVDFAWYELGRRRGAKVLARLCQLTLEPDSCLRRAQSIFARHGARSMLVAKFVPGLTTVMPPLAGVFAVARGRFALYDLAGVLLWAGTWLAVGYFFSDAIVLIAARATALGHMLGLVVGIALAGYILVKYVRRHLFLRKLRTERIPPEAPTHPPHIPPRIPRSRWLAAAPLGELLRGWTVALRPHASLVSLTIDRRQRRRSRLLNGSDRGFDASGLIRLFLARRDPRLDEDGRSARAASGQDAHDQESRDDSSV